MGKVSFIFGIHNHQPIGNLNHVFEDAYEKSYSPFIKILSNHPKIRWNLHCTGILWDWLEKNHPEYLEMAAIMVQRNQLELISGGYYEPILSAIPDADKIGQIQKLNQYLLDRFQTQAKGIWCAERVWEPHLPKPIRESGIEYTILDDTHFLFSGLSENQLTGYYKVEEQNYSVDIFPISKKLRYDLPYSSPEETIKTFEKLAANSSDNHSVLVMADDGEKFGFWPKTYELVYEKQWLEKFLQLLEKNNSWILTETFSDFRTKHSCMGRVYLPTASYFEMSEWTLPNTCAGEFVEMVHWLDQSPHSEKMRKFTRGGFWRNFLTKYPEANFMYKKMLRVSARIHKLEEQFQTKFKNKTSSRFHNLKNLCQEALHHLWAGQCNCAYWHGVFGGLYLPMLRQPVYKHLIEADSLADQLESKILKIQKSEQNGARFDCADFDVDGNPEILLETPSQDLYFKPDSGGTIFQWNWKPASVNLCNVLTRRQEHYHEKIKSRLKKMGAGSEPQNQAQSIHDLVEVKQEGLEDLLSYDWYLRSSLIDHFLHPGTELKPFSRCQYGEQGDFILGSYQYEILKTGNPSMIKLFRQGIMWDRDQKREVLVEKVVSLKDAAGKKPARASSVLDIDYTVTNCSDEKIHDLWFAPELNIAFSSAIDPVELAGVSNWENEDPYWFWKLNLRFKERTNLWIFPLETVSNSESGFEKTFQGAVLLPHWKGALEPKSSLKKSFSLALQRSIT